MVTIADSKEQQRQMAIMLVSMETFQKYVRTMGKEAVEMRDAMFIQILGDLPLDLVKEAILQYCKTNPAYPAPADIRPIAESLFYKRKNKLEKLAKLQQLASKAAA